MGCCDCNGGKTNENIDDAGKNGFLASEQQHADIPLEYSDQEPIKAADHEQCKCDVVEYFHGSNKQRTTGYRQQSLYTRWYIALWVIGYRLSVILPTFYVSISRDGEKEYNKRKVINIFINNMERKEDMCGMCEGSACGQCDMRPMQEEGSQCGMGCQQMYGMRCGGRHFLLRWILGILILVVVFVAGLKLGEFKERAWGGSYGGRMMERNLDKMSGYGMMQYRDDVDAYYRSGMMRGAGAGVPAAPVQ